MRWMVRTGYNIEGNAHYDCWTGACCSPCAVNQMLQTVQKNGRVQVPQVGPNFNTNPRKFRYTVKCFPWANGCVLSCYLIF
jgi:hypothetical protein